MTSKEKIKSTHLQRCVYVYVRQSTTSQVEYNRESTDRQYKLVVGGGCTSDITSENRENVVQESMTKIFPNDYLR